MNQPIKDGALYSHDRRIMKLKSEMSFELLNKKSNRNIKVKYKEEKLKCYLIFS